MGILQNDMERNADSLKYIFRLVNTNTTLQYLLFFLQNHFEAVKIIWVKVEKLMGHNANALCHVNGLHYVL